MDIPQYTAPSLSRLLKIIKLKDIITGSLVSWLYWKSKSIITILYTFSGSSYLDSLLGLFCKTQEMVHTMCLPLQCVWNESCHCIPHSRQVMQALQGVPHEEGVWLLYYKEVTLERAPKLYNDVVCRVGNLP